MFMKKHLSLLMILCMLIMTGSIVTSGKSYAATQSTYYVATTGNDSNPGTITQPFLTIKKARDVIRTVNSNMTGDIVVNIRGGLYMPSETLTFEEQDSGTNGYDIIYQAYSGEKPVISGGKKITGWTQHSGDIWKANAGIANSFRELYVNDQRAIRARSETTFTGTGWWEGAYSPKDGFYVNDSVIGNYNNADDIELSFIAHWRMYILPVDSIASGGTGKKIIKFKQPYASWGTDFSGGSTHSYYDSYYPIYTTPFYVENAYELIDQPGEWYYDKHSQYVYYKKKSFEDMSTAEVFAPVLEKVINIQGSSSASKVRHLKFMNLSIKHGTWNFPNGKGFVDTQADSYETGDLHRSENGYYINFPMRGNISASSSWSAGYEADKANDNSLPTIWASGASDTSASLAIDLGKEYRLDSIQLVGRQDLDQPATRNNFEVRASNSSNFASYTVLGSQDSTPFEYRGTWRLDTTDAATYRYVKVIKTDGVQFSIAELKVYTKGEEINYSAGKTITASTTWGTGYEANKAVDNSTGSIWASSDLDSQAAITVDLGAPHQIKRIEIAARQDLDQPATRRNFEIRASDDSSFSTYEVIGSQGSSAYAHQGTWVKNVPDTHTFRYIRVIKTVAESFVIAELRVFCNEEYSANVAGNHQVDASSSLGTGYEAKNATDINSSTSWASAVSDAYASITIDLGVEYKIKKIELVGMNAADEPITRRNFDVRASNTSSFASNVLIGSQGSTPYAYQSTWSVSSTESNLYRYIRVAKNVSEKLAISEIRVYVSNNFADFREDRGQEIPGGIQVENAEYIQFERNRIENMGAAGIRLEDGVSYSTIKGNFISDTSASGISVGAQYHKYTTSSSEEVNKHNDINNNVIRKTAQDYTSSLGILAYYVEDLEILHNDLADLPYTGISLGWGVSSNSKDNKVQYNRVFDVMKVMLDGGGIYTLGPQPNSIISDNYIRQGNANYGMIYHDNTTENFSTHDNVIEDAGSGAWLLINPPVNDVTVNNNYTTTSYQNIIGGTNISITNTQVYPYANWPTAANTIIANSGVESAYQDIVPENAALNKTVTASSIYPDPGFEANKANDGLNYNGWSPNLVTVDPRPWWQVDLGVQQQIQQVQITLRQDLDQPQTRRNFEVRASNSSNFSTYTVLGGQGNVDLPHQQTWVLDVDNTNTFRYIRIVKTADEYFYIGEAKVIIK